MISCESFLNRVYNFSRVCPNYKQGIAYPKHGNKIELVILNRVYILGFFFVLNRVRVSNPQRLTYTQYGWSTPPPPGRRTTKSRNRCLQEFVSLDGQCTCTVCTGKNRELFRNSDRVFQKPIKTNEFIPNYMLFWLIFETFLGSFHIFLICLFSISFGHF